MRAIDGKRSTASGAVRRGGAMTRAPFLLFSAILILSLAQITWWVVLLLRDMDPAQGPIDADARQRRIIMVAMEGTAFAVVTTLGAWLIYRSLRREEQLRRDEANFLAAITHELKSPIASIRLHAETLELRAADPERVKLYSSRMQADIDRLNRLVEDLLAAGRAQAGMLDVRPVPMDLSKELDQCIASMRGLLEERGFLLFTQIAPGIEISGDPGAIRTVIENLVDNAMKYSEPPSTISVALTATGGRALLEVRDEGVGLDPGEAARVFERFYRAGDERVRTTKGTGLGLYLVKEIATAHGGAVTVESRGRGQGSVFRVTIPALSA